jgi:hypothetical protein
MIRTASRAIALALLLMPAAWAQEAAVTRRATELRDAPGDRGRSIASLPAQSSVTRTNERQGAWVQVRTPNGATGWVHLFDVGPANAAGDSAGSVIGGALRGVTSLFGGQRAPQPTATAGIRGLDAEDLAQAQPNPAAVTQMEALRQSDAEVRSFAERSAWRPVAVEALPAPARAGAAPAARPGQSESP